ADDSLGPIFVDIAQLDLAAHLPVMCDFWETVLLRAGLYHRNARPRRRLFHPPPWLGGPPRRNPLHTHATSSQPGSNSAESSVVRDSLTCEPPTLNAVGRGPKLPARATPPPAE
ncbi:MAG: hypothetical protein ACRDRO_20720, partial [Pseudonocardiaceae bacterium]